MLNDCGDVVWTHDAIVWATCRKVLVGLPGCQQGRTIYIYPIDSYSSRISYSLNVCRYIILLTVD